MSGRSVSAADPAMVRYIAERGITEVLHFTTNKGLLGIFATGDVLCRDLLNSEQYIEEIYTPNCSDRLKDADWTGYVNLSISRVNGHMFGKSVRWHSTEDVWWAILAFDVSMLLDTGVYFTTTNNTYPCVQRDTGLNGLRSMFAGSVEWGYYGNRKYRHRGMPSAWTTDPQAEVLYPERVPARLLRAVYLREAEHFDHVAGLLSIFTDVPQVPILHKPGVFQ